MKTVVLKFGGTSVGSIDRIKNVAKIISSYKKKKMGVIVVSSAMSGTTNELIKKSISLTCSTISMFKITSNFFLSFNISGDATL